MPAMHKLRFNPAATQARTYLLGSKRFDRGNTYDVTDHERALLEPKRVRDSRGVDIPLFQFQTIEPPAVPAPKAAKTRKGGGDKGGKTGGAAKGGKKAAAKGGGKPAAAKGGKKEAAAPSKPSDKERGDNAGLLPGASAAA